MVINGKRLCHKHSWTVCLWKYLIILVVTFDIYICIIMWIYINVYVYISWKQPPTLMFSCLSNMFGGWKISKWYRNICLLKLSIDGFGTTVLQKRNLLPWNRLNVLMEDVWCGEHHRQESKQQLKAYLKESGSCGRMPITAKVCFSQNCWPVMKGFPHSRSKFNRKKQLTNAHPSHPSPFT